MTHDPTLGRPPEAAVHTLRASFWATSQLRNPELRLCDDHMELDAPNGRRRLVHRVRYGQVERVEFIEGRRFTDVIIRTVGGNELVAPGIRNAELAAAKPFLAARVEPG